MGNKFYDYETKTGLKICYINKPKFKTSYVGIGVRFGSRDVEFYNDGKMIKSKKGIAHFIEHKLFSMPDGDAFAKFSQMGAHANAYTDTEKTVYYFTTLNDLYAPLELLLNMYFTPYFMEEEVEKEKQIIISEIKMHQDDVQSQFFQKILNALYKNQPIATEATGTIQSVTKTTAQDLYEAYNAFYTAENSFLVIISKEPKQKVFSFIEEKLNALKIHQGYPVFPKNVYSSFHPEEVIFKAKTEQTTAALSIRLSASYEDPMLCSIIIGIFDSLFSPMASFYKKLHKEKKFYADIEYSVTSLSDTTYCIISTNTREPEEFLRIIEQKLRNLEPKDINKRITELYIKYLKSRALVLKDDIEALGEEALILGLENVSYQSIETLSEKLKLADFYAYIPYLHDGVYGKAICKKSEK